MAENGLQYFLVLTCFDGTAIPIFVSLCYSNCTKQMYYHWSTSVVILLKSGTNTRGVDNENGLSELYLLHDDKHIWYINSFLQAWKIRRSNFIATFTIISTIIIPFNGHCFELS